MSPSSGVVGVIAVVAETKDGVVRKASLEALAEARQLAGEAGGSVAAILLGAAGPGEAARLAQHGADRVVKSSLSNKFTTRRLGWKPGWWRISRRRAMPPAVTKA